MHARSLAALALGLLLATSAAAAPLGTPVELSPPARDALLEQAALALNAASQSDHVTAVAFTYPRLVKLMGGPDEAVQRLIEGQAGMRAQGVMAPQLALNGLLGCVQVGRQLQCALDEAQRIPTPKGMVRSQHDLIAFSDDRGAHWTFAPAGGSADDSARGAPRGQPLAPAARRAGGGAGAEGGEAAGADGGAVRRSTRIRSA
ncbi:MAG: hypothetical protein QM767_29015 [Anaeromyxobacter sp.]